MPRAVCPMHGGCRYATAFNRVLPSRWVMSSDARLAYFYHAFGMAFLRRCDHQILWPRRYLSEFDDGLCGHCNARFHLNPHTNWQATKRYVQRANAFGLVLHGLPPIRASRPKMLRPTEGRIIVRRGTRLKLCCRHAPSCTSRL